MVRSRQSQPQAQHRPKNTRNNVLLSLKPWIKPNESLNARLDHLRRDLNIASCVGLATLFERVCHSTPAFLFTGLSRPSFLIPSALCVNAKSSA